jgi:predicted Fe-Mo cluster-binding NifX family protein
MREWRHIRIGDPPCMWELLERISREGVDVVICCGVNRQASALLDSQGVQVLWGITGEAEEVVSAYLDGRLNEPGPRMWPVPGEHGGGRARGWGRRGGGWDSWQQVGGAESPVGRSHVLPARTDEGEVTMPGQDGTGPSGKGPRTGRGEGRCGGKGDGRGGGRGRRSGGGGAGRRSDGRGSRRGRGAGSGRGGSRDGDSSGGVAGTKSRKPARRSEGAG